MRERGVTTSVVYPREGVAVVEIHGEHDMTTKQDTELLLDQLLGDCELLVLDVSSAEFIDSSFLHTLLQVDRQAKSSGKQVRLQVGTAPIVKRALEISGVLTILDHAHDREEAIR